jgi:hypothetical protein
VNEISERVEGVLWTLAIFPVGAIVLTLPLFLLEAAATSIAGVSFIVAAILTTIVCAKILQLWNLGKKRRMIRFLGGFCLFLELFAIAGMVSIKTFFPEEMGQLKQMAD